MTDKKQSNPAPSQIVIGKNNYAYVEGVKIGRVVPERQTIEFRDPDNRRCQEKGRTTVEVKISDLVKLVAK